MNHWDSEDFQAYRDAFPEAARSSPATLQVHVEDLTRRDVKVAPLKNLQGFLWESGYKSGAYATPLFPDVVPKLREWKDVGIALVVYSSGSVFAQKLLFGHVSVTRTKGEKRARDVSEKDHLASGDRPNKKRSWAAGDVAAEDGDVDGDDDTDLEQSALHNNHDDNDDDDDEVVGDNDPQPATDEPDRERNEDDNVANGEKPSHVETEDLTHLFDDWFDTTNAGPKTEASSYTKIAEMLKVDCGASKTYSSKKVHLICQQYKPEQLLFLSDNVKEVDAALEVDMKSILIDRPGNAPLSETDTDRLTVMESLDGIGIQPVKSSSMDKHEE